MVDMLMKSRRLQSRARTHFIDGRGSVHATYEFPDLQRSAVFDESPHALIRELEDLGRIQDAIIAYKKAGAFADAHYNLSRLYELVGEHQQALKHLKTYRSLIEPR